MDSKLVSIILATETEVRDTPLEAVCAELSREELERECAALDRFRRESENLYERVRALLFLFAIHRYYLPARLDGDHGGAAIAFGANQHLLERRFAEAINSFQQAREAAGTSDAICSALAKGYHQLAIQNLADQVRASVRAVRGNQWMFRVGAALDHPLRVRSELLENRSGLYPIIHEKTAVRMDLTHSAWSDIFFLGMDFPDGARVLNISVDLAVHGRDPQPKPPVEGIFRIIDQPIIRLCSVDLGATAEIHDLSEVFDFAKDYLGLLKSALISAGVVPIGLEGSGQSLQSLLERIAGPGRGIELVSKVNDIPKGSRLAVSTNLLGALISACMRATGQTRSLHGPLEEDERRIVAARAILGEWLGGSGGGWQDSGGVWPGIKTIFGSDAGDEDPEFGISRGRLLPQHTILPKSDISAETRQKLQDSLVLVHGGMAQNVGPILEMVTEKYLLRSLEEWKARGESILLFDEVLGALREGDIRKLGELTTHHFFGPLQTIIPWATTYYTERLIDDISAEFKNDFWGFWMLGGMSGGGMGFMFEPSRKAEALGRVNEIMQKHKKELEHSLPFAMDPVVYDFAINENGTASQLLAGEEAMMPTAYYGIVMPKLLQGDQKELSEGQRTEATMFEAYLRSGESAADLVGKLLSTGDDAPADHSAELQSLLDENGFDPIQHATIGEDLQSGRIGMAKNRLPFSSKIEDVEADDVQDALSGCSAADITAGQLALESGEVAVVTLAAGAASRWTEGAGVVKGLHPFCKFGERHRTFLEVHLAKTRKAGEGLAHSPYHVITTSYITDDPIRGFLEREDFYGLRDSVRLSRGRSVGLRMIPTARDLRFEWQETSQQVLDERAQKMRESLRAALLDWATTTGEASDYRDNLPMQCLHPVGHWFEVPNLLLNGTLQELLAKRPGLRTLMLHNIDTLGAGLDPGMIGLHRRRGSCLTFEVIHRRLEDRGGGLARVDGRARLVEGLALPREEDEFDLTYYNTNTCWIDIDQLLGAFGLDRNSLTDADHVAARIRDFGQRMHTYVTHKEVKKRWGHGQEDIFPVAQFEKLWGDMTAVDGISSSFAVVPRMRGQQLKEQAQLDAWLRDGSRDYVDSLCAW